LPSSRSRPQPLPEILVDRGLGATELPEALRALDHGLVVHTLRSLYGERAAQRVPDEQWIADAAVGGWLWFTKDDVTKVPIQLDAMIRSRSRGFWLPNAGLPGPRQVEHFTFNINRILRRAQAVPGPYLVGVYMTKPYIRWKWRPS
jgi:PIN like domain